MPQVSTGAKPEKGLQASVLTGIALMKDSAAQILFAELDLHNSGRIPSRVFGRLFNNG
jgi:hypothetical protein